MLIDKQEYREKLFKAIKDYQKSRKANLVSSETRSATQRPAAQPGPQPAAYNGGGNEQYSLWD